MTSYSDVVGQYEAAVSRAGQILMEGQEDDEIVIAGVNYMVSWGVHVDDHEGNVDTFIHAEPPEQIAATKSGPRYYSDRHARLGLDMPTELRNALLRGHTRLYDWRDGGAFPESAADLFAPLPEDVKP